MNGSMFRVALPGFATCPLVKLCVDAVRFVLPRDKAIQALLKWYCLRNAPGGPGLQSEWHKFMLCLLGMMGYDTEKLPLTGVRIHPKVFFDLFNTFFCRVFFR